MNVRPSILCPVDYSEASAGALQYAVALAEHFATRLIVLNVDDSLLNAAAEFVTGDHSRPEDSERELAEFVTEACENDAAVLAMCEPELGVGRPGAEILRVARERSCDLIVMSSHGVSGARKLLFGSTTERVLRDTRVPVLVTPPLSPGRIRVEDAARLIGRIAVPVDLSPASVHQAGVAAGLAVALGLPLVFVHVLEAADEHEASADLGELEAARTAAAQDRLDALVATVTRQLATETLVVAGEPAEEVARLVSDRRAGLVVMAVHGSPLPGHRVGSVTYRTLCRCTALVLALPPKYVAPPHKHAVIATTRSSSGENSPLMAPSR